MTAFGWNQAEATAVLGAMDAFLTARAGYEADDSTVKCIAKDEAKKVAKTAMRDEDCLFYGIHPADGTNTPDTAPAK